MNVYKKLGLNGRVERVLGAREKGGGRKEKRGGRKERGGGRKEKRGGRKERGGGRKERKERGGGRKEGELPKGYQLHLCQNKIKRREKKRLERGGGMLNVLNNKTKLRGKKIFG